MPFIVSCCENLFHTSDFAICISELMFIVIRSYMRVTSRLLGAVNQERNDLRCSHYNKEIAG